MSYRSQYSTALDGFMNRTLNPRDAWDYLIGLGYGRSIALGIVIEWLRKRDSIPDHVRIVLDFEGEHECA